MYLLDVSVNLDGKHDLDEINDKLETIVGRRSDGSGIGFGCRDLDWSFKTFDAADKAAKRIKRTKLDIYKLTVSKDYLE